MFKKKVKHLLFVNFFRLCLFLFIFFVLLCFADGVFLENLVHFFQSCEVGNGLKKVRFFLNSPIRKILCWIEKRLDNQLLKLKKCL